MGLPLSSSAPQASNHSSLVAGIAQSRGATTLAPRTYAVRENKGEIKIPDVSLQHYCDENGYTHHVLLKYYNTQCEKEHSTAKSGGVAVQIFRVPLPQGSVGGA